MNGYRAAQILIIEDDTAVREGVAKVLSRAGYSVLKSSNGREGLEILEKEPCDIVLTDIIMPEMEGIETITRIAKQYPGLKVVAMSGGGRLGNTDFLKVASQIGAVDTIAKPATAKQLLETIEKHLPPFARP